MPDSSFRQQWRSMLINRVTDTWPAYMRALLNYEGDGDERVYPIWRKTAMGGEFDHLAQFVDPSKAAIDVGALLGQYSLTLSALATRCLCIEPLQKYAFLAKVLPSNCKVCTVAAGEKLGRGLLRTPDHNYGLSSLLDNDWLHRAEVVTQQEIAIEPLDEIVAREFSSELIGFVKIDVEGYELSVLRGAKHLLETQQPNLQIEIGPENLHVVQELLRGYGYIGLFYFEERLHEIGQFDRHIHLNPANAWTPDNAQFDLERYVVNFFFIPKA